MALIAPPLSFRVKYICPEEWTLRFDIDGAYLFSLPYVDNVSIDGYELEVRQDLSKYEKE